MKDIDRNVLVMFAAALCLVLSPPVRSAAPAASTAQTPAASHTNATVAKGSVQRQGEVAQSRQEAERQAKDTLDRDAIVALEQTRKAIEAIGAGKSQEALAAIEQASGKIDILVARNPAVALIPVQVEVELHDNAPREESAITEQARRAERALDRKEYSAARVALEGLSSEIRTQTYHLPLASYPRAMQEAARLLDQHKSVAAREVLQTALNTLVVTEVRTPVPLMLAELAVKDAQGKRETDKAGARKLLAAARQELDRAELLGYTAAAPDYASLNRSISDLQKQLEGPENTSSAFAALRSKLTGFLQRLSNDTETRGSDNNATARN